ncbi:MAG: hypothetical protein U0800_09535 [Isosphaeraceae bacterium]
MHRLASIGLALASAALLGLSLVRPWMEVPIGLREQADGSYRCLTAKPRSAIPFRLTCGGFAVVMGVGHAWHRRTSDRKAMLAGAFLASQLFFPYVVMALEPSLSARANWLHIQHENLTWLGGDLPTNLEFSRTGWNDYIYMVDTPRQINVVRMPSSGLAAFQWGRLMTWFEALGYSNRFCQFAKLGWGAAIFGTGLLVIAECLPGGRLNRRRATRGAAAAATTFAIGAVVAMTPILLASLELDRCREAVARGHYDEAERRLRLAARDLPALREDTFFVAQLGLIDFRRDRVGTPEGRLFRATLLERQGRYAQAVDEYLALVDSSPPGGAVHREALRAILRAGLHALNGQRNDLACEWLEQVLRREPCNLKANYALQFAYLRTWRREELERLIRQIKATYDVFQMPTKAIVLSSSYENAMLAAFREGDTEAAVEFERKARKP